jgi:hypothetical protein
MSDYKFHADNEFGCCSCGAEDVPTIRSQTPPGADPQHSSREKTYFYCPFCYETTAPAEADRGECSPTTIARMLNILLRELRNPASSEGKQV